MILTRFTKKALSIILLLTITFSLVTTPVKAAQSTVDDLKGHWAEPQLRKWAEGDLLKGYNGAYYPDQPITRAELITLINRSFKLSEKAEIKFTDLVPSHWAYDQIAIAVKAGYVKGYDDQTIRLDQPISREESAVMVTALLELDSSSLSDLSQFKDAASISEWSKPAILALLSKTIIVGNKEGNFTPKGKLTRAEAVTLLEKAIEYANLSTDAAYSAAGVYGPETGTETIKGNVIVSAPGITLQNIIIEGNLTLTEGIGEGDAFLKKVTVKGETTIQGGGLNSIHLEDSVMVRISIDKKTGTVRVVVSGESSIQSVVVHSPVKLEESSLTNSGFANVELSKDLPTGSQVSLIGQFEDVQVLSSNIKVSIPSGSIKQLNVAEGTVNTEVNVNANASIMELVLNAVAKLLGEGTIAKATVNNGAAGSTFEKNPTAMDGEAAKTIPTPTPIPSSTTTSPSTSTSTPTPSTPTPTPSIPTPSTPTPSEPTPTPSNNCTGTTDECRNAKLLNLTVSGYTLNQQDANQYTTDATGFSPEVLSYSVITVRDMAPASTTLSITKSTYSTVSYAAWDSGSVFIKAGTITDKQSSFDLQVAARQDMRIRITVTSGDHIASKTYEVITQYPRTLQEAVKIGSYSRSQSSPGGETTWKKEYSLQVGTLEGEKIHYNDSVSLFEFGVDTPFSTGTNNLTIPTEKAVGTGNWIVKISRNGNLIVSGEYHYDFTIAPVLTADIGLEAKAYTKQELIDTFNSYSGFSVPFESGYKLFINSAKVRLAYPNATYVMEGSQDMFKVESSLSQGLSLDELKVGTQPNGYNGFSMSYTNYIYYNNSSDRQEIGGSVSSQSDYEGASKLINDKFVYLALYDENFQLIGQYITVVEFDKDHVADGYTAVGNWVPTLP